MIMISILVYSLMLCQSIASAEDITIEQPEVEIVGDTIEEAEMKVTVMITGDDIGPITLKIQFCDDGMCYMPIDVTMNDLGGGLYQGTYSDFEAGYEYYQYQISVKYGDEKTESTVYKHVDGLPGYESDNGDDDDTTGDNDTTEDDDTNGTPEKKDEEESPGFSVVLLFGIVILIASVLYLAAKRK